LDGVVDGALLGEDVGFVEVVGKAVPIAKDNVSAARAPVDKPP